MEFYKKPMALFALLLALLQVSMTMGAVYKVGDSVGWTTIGSPDYKKWASSKTFHVGDIIVFTYNTQFHNVLQVNHSDFSSCNVSSPIATHTTGNDSIAIKKSGHYYYVCGVPGHCQSGQKVDIRVLAAGSSPTAAPSPAGSSPAASSGNSPPDSVAPVPSPKNTATLPSTGFFGPVALVLAVFTGFGF